MNFYTRFFCRWRGISSGEKVVPRDAKVERNYHPGVDRNLVSIWEYSDYGQRSLQNRTNPPGVGVSPSNERGEPTASYR